MTLNSSANSENSSVLSYLPCYHPSQNQWWLSTRLTGWPSKKRQSHVVSPLLKMLHGFPSHPEKTSRYPALTCKLLNISRPPATCLTTFSITLALTHSTLATQASLFFKTDSMLPLREFFPVLLLAKNVLPPYLHESFSYFIQVSAQMIPQEYVPTHSI